MARAMMSPIISATSCAGWREATPSAIPDWLEIGHCGTDATGNEDTADEKAGDIDRMAQ
jgi:hypothetical protein